MRFHRVFFCPICFKHRYHQCAMFLAIYNGKKTKRKQWWVSFFLSCINYLYLVHWLPQYSFYAAISMIACFNCKLNYHLKSFCQQLNKLLPLIYKIYSFISRSWEILFPLQQLTCFCLETISSAIIGEETPDVLIK